MLGSLRKMTAGLMAQWDFQLRDMLDPHGFGPDEPGLLEGSRSLWGSLLRETEVKIEAIVGKGLR